LELPDISPRWLRDKEIGRRDKALTRASIKPAQAALGSGYPLGD
jgi:hypothetical protein